MVAMQEISLDDFDKLVHDIYRAGIQPDLWSQVVGTLSHLLGGAVISLQAHSIGAKASLGTITSEADSSVQNDYENYYATKNVWMPGLQNIPKGRTIHAEEFFDRRELKRTEFYNDFLRPRGFIGASALILERSENAVLVISGTLTDKEMETVPPVLRRIFDLVGPHILRSFETMRKVPNLRSETENRHTLQPGGHRTFFLDRRGRLVHLSNTGADLRYCGNSVYIDRHGCLKWFDPQAERSFQVALNKVTNADYQNLKGDFNVRRNGETPLAASVVPLDSQIAGSIFDQVFEDIPVALLILRDQAAPDRVEALREFKLTPAEAALTLAIAKGLSLREYAEGRDLSIQTVRTQLKAVFAKTDTNRQSQLVALVMSL